jgi:hypothetical protein
LLWRHLNMVRPIFLHFSSVYHISIQRHVRHIHSVVHTTYSFSCAYRISIQFNSHQITRRSFTSSIFIVLFIGQAPVANLERFLSFPWSLEIHCQRRSQVNLFLFYFFVITAVLISIDFFQIFTLTEPLL